jgi:MYXO-CTERM domain-containing protein
LIAKLGLTLAVLAPLSFGGLIGQNVFGELFFAGGSTNFFNSANGFVPAGYLNSGGATTVTIGEPAQEFGFQDSVNRDVANFTDTQLILTDTNVTVITSNNSIVYRFTSSTPGLFTGVSLASNSYPVTPSLSLVGNVITVSFAAVSIAGFGAQATDYVTTINVSTAAVPEPSTLLLGAAGLAGLIAWRRRSRRA